MASFVIHHIAGEQFLKEIEQKCGITLTEEEKNNFLLGNLIVDSTRLRNEIPENLSKEEKSTWKLEFQKMIQAEKVATHFRDKEDYRLCIQAPNLKTFLKKYQSLLAQYFSVLGYFYHLYTDKLFFNDLFCATFEPLDQDFHHTDYLDELAFILIKKSGAIEKKEDVFVYDSDVSIYQDYTVMNHLLLEHYKVSFHTSSLLESSKQFHNPGIAEVDYENIDLVIEETKSYINESYQTEGKLHVFTEEQVKNFIQLAAESFIESYYPLFERLVNPSKGEKQKNYRSEQSC